ncbi:MAG: Coenzyme F420 hydrogenase/dehydrogenase, beta subunit C-terminal domain [Ruminococcus sp.]|nr:Coenzyme F420 hydrogenase/dehydrogenase, beta subunit C-terminal domain [Ruminococcus sp.]
MKHRPNVNYTTSHNLCTGCGVCKLSCPFNAIEIGIEKGCFRPYINSERCMNSKGCHRCYTSCPGINVNLESESNRLFPLTLSDYFIGKYLKCYSGYSNNYDIRLHSASGGLVSQFLIYLLEKGHIDGAIVTRFDRDSPLKVKTFIATTSEEILQAKSSKYGPVHFGGLLELIKETTLSRLVVVGLPCHIEGLRKCGGINKSILSKIKGYFSIFCSSGRSYYLTDYVCRERGFSPDKLKDFSYRDNGCLGNMVATYTASGIEKVWEEPFESYYQSLASFFVPTRCKLCMDHYGELADICFGDIHIEPYIRDKVGISSVIIRNKEWLKLFEDMGNTGYATLASISQQIVNDSQPMAKVKKNRNYIFGKIRALCGLKSPTFDTKSRATINIFYIKWYIASLSQHFIGFNKWMWWLIPYVKVKTKIKNLRS